MKKILPRTSTNTQGFTLIELLVVIAIIAILSMIGLTVFTTIQKNARDAKRKADINSIANAIEMKRTPGTSYYDANITAGDFGAGVIPTENYIGGSWSPKYSIAVFCNAVNTGVTAPAVASTWATTGGTGIPSAPGASGSVTAYAAIPTTTNVTPISTSGCGSKVWAWTVCAHLESGANAVYCKSNAQ